MAGLRVIGLGNSILSDDAVGLHVAREVARRLLERDIPAVEVLEAAVGGFELMELMCGARGVVLVDALELPGVEPGAVRRLERSELATSLRLRSPHEVDLTTALELGRRLDQDMPRELVIVGVQGRELRRFGEELSPEVAAAVPTAAERVLAELERLGRELGGG